ncbi:T9SS type A sorting domain-containing protein [Flavobacterium microcysteis]
MKKITFLIAFFLAFVLKGYSQTLNQSAGWPNPAWTITGTYNSDPVAFESDPRTTASFAYDDDDAGNSSHEDNIAAESPVIDLTPAFTAGEKALEITVQYGYRYLADDVLRFEYWNADTSTWVPWGANIPGNYTATAITDNFCTLPKTALNSETLSIAAFTPTQLAGFKYRIYYNDSLTGADWNYGFCFSSPTIKSIACVAPLSLTVASFSSSGANITWAANTSFEYVLDNVSTDPTVAGTTTSATSYSPSGLNPLTVYYFHIRTICSGGPSAWRTISFTTRANPPANDNCAGAIALTVNANLACTVKTSGTLVGATDSGVADTGAGIPDDDVWYSFVATSTAHRIVLSNVAGTPTDIVHEVMSGACGALTSVLISDPNTSTVTGLTIGNTYYIRVFSFAASVPTNTTTFDLCIGTIPGPPANDNCSGAVALTVNADYMCGVKTPGTLQSATVSSVPDNGAGTPDDDVWFSFVATATTHRIILSNVTGTPTDIVHETLSGTCDGLVSVLVSDADTSNPTGLVIGNTYYVRVFSYAANSNADTTFNVCVGTLPGPPANDECAGAITLTVNADLACGVKTTGTLQSSTASPEPDNGAGTPDDDVWYKFVATSTSHTFTISNVAGTPTDLVHEVLSGTCGGGLVSLNISDPNTSAVSGLVVGQTYYLRVFGFGVVTTTPSSTTFDICIGTPPGPPANDDCVSAVTLTVNADLACGVKTSGTLQSATNSNEGDNGAGVPDDDVWYKFVATATSQRIVISNVAGTPTDIVHEVLDGTCGGGLFSLLISDPNTSTVTGLTPGNTYYVRVFSLAAASPLNTTTFDICIGTLPGPPANDNCSGAIALTVNADLACGVKTSGTLQSATDSGVPDNGAGTPNDDVWYTFVATTGSHRIALSNVAGTPTDLVHELMVGTCAGLVSLNISDPDTSNYTGLIPGTTYYVRIFSYGTATDATTTFDVCIGSSPAPAVPANNEPTGAVNLTVNPALTCTATTAGTTIGATQSAVAAPACSTAGFNDDVWYTFTATAVRARFTFSGTATGAVMVAALYTGTPGSLVEVTGTCAEGNTLNFVNLTVGTVYYARVFTSSALPTVSSAFTLCVGTPPAPPANDNCAQAVALTPTATYGNVTDGTNAGATASSTETAPTSCDGYSGGDVWYSVVVPASGNITVETGNTSTGTSGFDSVVTVYSGACGSLVQVGCDDDGAATGSYSKAAITGQTPGATLYIRVYEYSNDSVGSFGIAAYDASLSTPTFDDANFKAYPNPVVDVLNLSYTQEISNVSVFNLLGQQVISKTIGATDASVDMSNLAAGTYLVKVAVDNQIKTIKVIKQ